MRATLLYINILAIAILATTVSCNDEAHNENMIQTITASIEQPATKTALDGPDADGVYKTVWSPEDAIAVCSDDVPPREFKLASGANTNKAEFKGSTFYSDVMLAVYPYSIVKEIGDSEIIVVLPEIQEYEKGNIPQGAYPMFSSSKNTQFTFKNLCSVLKFRMFGDLTIKSITLTPNDSNIKVSGDAFIDINSKELVVYKDANPSVRLNCSDGVKLTSEPTDFLMVVPAQKYTGGFTITICTNEGTIVKTIKSDMTLNRSTLYPSEVFECNVGEGKENIVFEDVNFKTYMVANFDTDNDGEISLKEALKVTEIEVNTDNIESLAGIEHMTNLVSLKCRGENSGRLVKLGLSKNTNLKTLFCDGNQLSTLDVSDNIKLDSLVCANNHIVDLDVSSNTSLLLLECSGNKLSHIDLSNNHNLQYLRVFSNNLTSIDVSNCPKLKIFICSRNEISSALDLSKCEELTLFQCMNNNIPSIKMSPSAKLHNFNCGENKLESLDISANTGLMDFSCYGNKLKSLDVSHNKVLYALNCSTNNLERLDVTSNIKLQSLDCYENNLKGLDITHNPELYSLYCNDNEIVSLDICNNKALTWLYCQDNPLKTLYAFKGQYDAIKYKNIPDFTQIIESVIPGGNNDTTTGDKIRLE